MQQKNKTTTTTTTKQDEKHKNIQTTLTYIENHFN